MGLHLLAEPVPGTYYSVLRDLGAAIHLTQDAVETEGFLQTHKTVGDAFWRADDQFFAQRFLVGNVLQPPSARRPQLTLLNPRAGRRVFEPFAEVAVEIHDALFRLLTRRPVGFGDIDRRAQEDLALARMARLLPRLAIGGDIRFQLFEGALAHRDQHAMTELGDARKGVRAVGGDADIRPRLLVGLWRHLDIVEAVVLAVIAQGRFGPRPLHDFERFGKALAALAVGHAIGFVGPRKAAAPDPENQPALADLIDRRRFFGEPQRMTERQYLDTSPDFHTLRAGGDGTDEGQRRRAHRPFRVNVDFGEPHRVEPPALGGIDFFKRGGERRLVGNPGGPLKLVEHAELERHRPFSFLRRHFTAQHAAMPVKKGLVAAMADAKRREFGIDDQRPRLGRPAP